MPRSGADSHTDGCNIPYRCRERSNWTLSQEMPGNLQKGPPMRQISLAAWTRRPAGIKGFAWRILPPGPADSFRMTDPGKNECQRKKGGGGGG